MELLIENELKYNRLNLRTVENIRKTVANDVDVEKKVIASYGIIEYEVRKEKLELRPIECPRCKTKNPYDSKYCICCSMVLDMETAVKLEEKSKAADDDLTKLAESIIQDLIEAKVNEKLMSFCKMRSPPI